jgi:TldD protein
MKKLIVWLTVLMVLAGVSVIRAESKTESDVDKQLARYPLMQHLLAELEYSMEHLVGPDGTRPYYLAYTVYDEEQAVLMATLGALDQNHRNRTRNLNIDLRVGDYDLDNTRQLRGGGASHAQGSGNIALPLADDGEAIRHILWYHTDEEFKSASDRLSRIKTNLQVKVEEEDQSADFSKEEAHAHFDTPAAFSLDHEGWAKRVRSISAIARDYPQIYNSQVTLGAYAATRYMVNSEGARLVTAQTRYRITLTAESKAEDGMDLNQSVDFNASTEDGLPSERAIREAFVGVIEQVMALRSAPLAEPYIGPAILRNRASAVFFHEIFGHRIEGHRQRDVTEGQTFRRKIGEPVLPSFIDVHDDPTLAKFDGVDLRGFYRFDDEGVEAQDVMLVKDGVLKTFLMSRRPVEGFPKSNGHGRRQAGYASTARQANLIVRSKKQVSFEALREKLIEECKRQEKPFGLLFEDISGGFTTTTREGPQSYKVIPIVVYRVYADGRPDELIRGADIVGTPLTSFERILATADDPAVFNGSCGAESGWVPVSAISPSVLVGTIEIEKRRRDQSRPPILPQPLDGERAVKTAAR